MSRSVQLLDIIEAERNLKVAATNYHTVSRWGGPPCGVMKHTPQGKGGGGPPNRIPPHLNPLPPRGEEVFCGVIF